jgi:phosphate:Na+ symporter
MQIFLDAAGGLALFLFAMLLLTDGLKAYAGDELKRLLERWTSTPLRGVFAGILITGVVQSSSAVTVAAIGFVNAGVLTLRQALGVIFGTNVGTTVTGWLVSLVGFGLKIESFALPILAVGVLLRLVSRGRRRQGLGTALVGFGLLFLGLAILKDAFSGFALGAGASAPEAGAPGWLAMLVLGFLATLLTQSSSAAIAIILTAAAGGAVNLEAAAVAVIGANVGTTSTAAVAALKATPSAKRLALGHILFNVVTGAVAIALLPTLLWLVAFAAEWLGVAERPAVFLALFHTVFNVLGVALMLPFTGRLAAALERLFRSEEEELGRPQHLDATLAATPALAVGALREELQRLRAVASNLALAALGAREASPQALVRRAEAARALDAAITAFVGAVHTESMAREVAEDLARELRISRYLDEAARLAPRAAALRRAAHGHAAVARALEAAAACAELAGREVDAPGGDAERTQALERFEQVYQEAKAALLAGAVARSIAVERANELLAGLSATRRLVEQLVKADRLLRTPGRAAAIEAEAPSAPA